MSNTESIVGKQFTWSCSYCHERINLNDDGVTFTKRYRSIKYGRLEETLIACGECDHD